MGDMLLADPTTKRCASGMSRTRANSHAFVDTKERLQQCTFVTTGGGLPAAQVIGPSVRGMRRVASSSHVFRGMEIRL